MPVPAKQLADVAQPAGLAVDEVLALAAAVDAAGDVDLAGVDRPAAPALLSSVSVTSAVPSGPRVAQPLKMTSIISWPRSDLALCEPRTHLMASTTLDLPEPLGPTTIEMPRGKLEPRAVGEALEAGEFERFEHGRVEGRESSVESRRPLTLDSRLSDPRLS